MIGEFIKFKYYTSGLNFFKKEFSFDKKIEKTNKYTKIISLLIIKPRFSIK